MQVEITFTDVPAGVLQLRMSRSSPGRYALHEFAKNVFNVQVTDTAGMPLTVTRPNPHQWDVNGHSGHVRVTYSIFGDRVDGTYLGIDSTHAHINMPAALMWARGLELRAATVRFEPPPGSVVARRHAAAAGRGSLHVYRAEPPVPDGQSDGAQRLQPAHVPASPACRAIRSSGWRCITTGTDAELDAFAGDVQKVVRRPVTCFGEYPAFEGNTYTFIADYLPWASGDGMEHRNSTFLTSPSSIRTNRLGLLDTVSHEFFHAWNVERIRPRSLEPFNFEDANMSGELWLAEGFTSYYGPLDPAARRPHAPRRLRRQRRRRHQHRHAAPGPAVRSAEEMSQFAPFVDAATSIDPDELRQHVHLLLHVGRSDRPRPRPDAARPQRRQGHARSLHAGALAESTGSRAGGCRATWTTRTRWPIPRARSLRSPATRRLPTTSSRATSRGTRCLITSDCSRAPVSCCGRVRRAGLRRCRFAAGRTGQRPRVAGLVPFGSPAYAAGLERDDSIVSIGGAAPRAPPRSSASIRMRQSWRHAADRLRAARAARHGSFG